MKAKFRFNLLKGEGKISTQKITYEEYQEIIAANIDKIEEPDYAQKLMLK